METRDWRQRSAWIADLLKRRTGDDLETWTTRVDAGAFLDESSLRAWLTEQGVTGYPQQMLVMERFGYPAFLLASADELIDGQYADRPRLRPILDAVLVRAASIGQLTAQARKTYVSLLTPRRTFAAVQATTRHRVDLGLKFATPKHGGRLLSAVSMGSSMVNTRVELSSVEDVDDDVQAWQRRAYQENA
jgi:hypothetical protein